MSEQIGNNGNELTLIIPSALERDWATSIRDNCFSAISSHDHSGSGSGKKLTAADAIDSTAAWLANDTYLLFKDNAGTSTVNVIKATTSDELQFGTTIAVADFQSDGLTVSDASDNTKKLDLAVSAITTGTTRTLTMPDANVDLGALDNSNIASGAAIAVNKLAALTASRAVVSDGSGFLSASAVTSTELGYVSGVTSAIQTQLDAKQASDADLTALAALSSTGLVARTGSGTYSERTVTGTTNEIDVTNGDGVSGNPTIGIADNPVIPGTDSMVVPKGTTAQRVSTTDGAFRFNSDLNRFEGYKNSAWSELGGGAGGINFITDNDAEVGTGDWATYADAAGENAVDGTGGAATITWTQNSTTPLRDSNDFKFTKDAANRQGEGVGYAFSIDNADKSQKVYISFDYDASDSNYADDDVRIAVYDVTNANLIRVNGEDLKGGKGKYLGWFQAAADSTSYRLIIHQSSTNATAYSLYFDNISVGPREASFGSALTDWKSYTPTISNLTLNATGKTDPTGWYKREGDSAKVRVLFVNGSGGAATGSGDILIGLPDGLSIDTSKVNSFEHLGSATPFSINSSSTFESEIGVVYRNASGGIALIKADAGARIVASDITASAEMYIEFSVPIQGWSSNALMSEDIGNREVRVRGAGNGGGTVTANVTNIDFTEVEDTTASWNGTQFTAPETGDYDVEGYVIFTASTSRSIIAYIDGVSDKALGVGGNPSNPISGTVYLEKGQVLSFRSNVTLTLSNNSTFHHIYIKKKAQPQTLLETETVAARYTSNSGQTVTSTSPIVYEDLVYDTHNAYNTSTGVYTVPVKGKYIVSGMFRPSSAVGSTIGVEVNGTEILNRVQSSNFQITSDVTMTIDLEKGDTVEITNAGGPSVTLESTTVRNSFSIARIK